MFAISKRPRGLEKLYSSCSRYRPLPLKSVALASVKLRWLVRYCEDGSTRVLSCHLTGQLRASALK